VFLEEICRFDKLPIGPRMAREHDQDKPVCEIRLMQPAGLAEQIVGKGSNSRPASINFSVWPERVNNPASSDSSSDLMWWLMVGWVTCHRRAAFEKLRLSAA
jgi:hypothetical protein